MDAPEDDADQAAGFGVSPGVAFLRLNIPFSYCNWKTEIASKNNSSKPAGIRHPGLQRFLRMKPHHPKRIFQDSWRPEDKALESAEEEVLEEQFPEEIARERAERHVHTPPLRGFEKAPPEHPEP